MKNILTIFTAIAVLTSCSSDDGTTAAADTSYSYAGPGSNWEFTYTGGTFQLKESVAIWVIDGTMETLASGFKKLTVTSASGTGAPSAGDAAYGLDVPGVVFLLKPIAANSNIIPMVVSGSCPSADTPMNWVMTKIDDDVDLYKGTGDTGSNFDSDNINNEQELIGTVTVTSTGATLTKKYTANSADVTGSPPSMAITCSAGKGSVDGGAADMYLTASGGAIVRMNGDAGTEDDRIIMAMPGAQSISSGAADGDFVGLGYSSEDTIPIKGELSGSTLTVKQIDADTGSETGFSGSVTIENFDQPATGFVKGYITGQTNQKVLCTVNTNVVGSGKSVIFCAGMDSAAGGTDKLFNALLISK